MALKKLSFAGFLLEKSTPEDLIYSIDYRLLKEGEKEEYLALFASAGWEHVCSSYDIHIFKAPSGTNPIYSDVESAEDKINRLSRPVLLISKFIFPIMLSLLILLNITNGPIQELSRIAFYASFIIATPTLMMIIANLYRRMKISMTREF